MRYKIDFSHMPAYVLVCTEGEASVSGFEGLLSAIVNAPEWVPGTDQIVDHRRLKAADLSAGSVEAIKDVVRGAAGKLGTGKTAFVVADSLSFGLARMYELLGGDQIHGGVGTFYSEEEAAEWLASSDTSESGDG